MRGEASSLSFEVEVSFNRSSVDFDSSPSTSTLNLYPTTVSLGGEDFSGIGVSGYVNENDKILSILESTVKIESHTEISQIQSYYEGVYLPTTTNSFPYNGQQNLFGTLTVADEVIIFELFQCLQGLSITTESISVKINSSASEEGKLVITGHLQSYLNNFSEKTKSSITWSW